MSGHSKWAQIKHKKGAADAKRGALFTKLARAITVAAKNGADPTMNFQLRLAIDQARAANMPRENIERAIARGTGEGKEGIEQIMYEAYGPGGVAILIDVLTDNKNRTVSNLKHILASHGGNLANPGSVTWMFERKGVVRLKGPIENREALELKLIDAGAQDIKDEDGDLIIYSAPDKLKEITEALGRIPLEYSGIEWIAKDKISVTDTEIQEKLEKLYNALDEDDDVNDYSSNQA